MYIKYGLDLLEHVLYDVDIVFTLRNSFMCVCVCFLIVVYINHYFMAEEKPQIIDRVDGPDGHEEQTRTKRTGRRGRGVRGGRARSPPTKRGHGKRGKRPTRLGDWKCVVCCKSNGIDRPICRFCGYAKGFVLPQPTPCKHCGVMMPRNERGTSLGSSCCKTDYMS